MNNRNLLLPVPESQKSRMKVLAASVSGEGLILVHRQPPFHCLHMAEGLRELSGISFINILIPLMRTPASGPVHLPTVIRG